MYMFPQAILEVISQYRDRKRKPELSVCSKVCPKSNNKTL